MTEKSDQIIPIFKNFAKNANISQEQYHDWYAESLENPEDFWSMMSERLDWFEEPEKIKNTSFKGNVDIKWFEDGILNVCYNCVDRHLEFDGEKTAIIWEGDNPSENKHITYNQLYKEVCKFANLLEKYNVKKGDRVTIYMPMIPEAAYAMLAAARIGAVHNVVFAGFSPDSLSARIADCKSDFIITADESIRGGKITKLKQNVDQAIKTCGRKIKQCFVVKRTNADISWNNIDICYQDEIANISDQHEPAEINAEDPLFILYTSGSTGKPKGVLHTSGGYLLYVSLTHYCIFDIKTEDVYWCTADIGWITGHSYIVYGPLANGATTLMFEGVPTYPDANRFWQVIEKHKVNSFYTAPTAIRALMQKGDDYVNKHDLSCLRLLGTVGEPINPEAWQWYFKTVGKENCPIVDTWWQTETGGVLITPLGGVTDLKAGSATLPFFGVEPAIIDKNGQEVLDKEAEGQLCIKNSWPGQARTVYGNHQRFIDTYFTQNKGYYTTGDGAKRDKDGYYWITGRVDDVLNVCGHRLGTAEIESALVAHPAVSEAAVIAIDHEVKGQAIYAFTTLMDDYKIDNEAKLIIELKDFVAKEISAIAKPEIIQITADLPKTRSGKIMRRILRKIAQGQVDELGDTSTLLNPQIIDELIEKRNKSA